MVLVIPVISLISIIESIETGGVAKWIALIMKSIN